MSFFKQGHLNSVGPVLLGWMRLIIDMCTDAQGNGGAQSKAVKLSVKPLTEKNNFMRLIKHEPLWCASAWSPACDRQGVEEKSKGEWGI